MIIVWNSFFLGVLSTFAFSSLVLGLLVAISLGKAPIEFK